MISYQEINSTRRIEDAVISTRSWGGSITMGYDVAAQFELGEVYWLEQKQLDFLRPDFRRRARVISIDHVHDYVTIGFVAVPNPPLWSQTMDPESRQLAGLPRT